MYHSVILCEVKMRSLHPILFIYFVSGVLADNECTKNSDCLIESSICENKKCVCPADFVYNSERTKCLKVSHGYGAPCADSIQCSTSLEAGGICDNGTCKCSNGYHYFKGQCWKTAGLGEKCVQNSNCFVSYDFEASICNDEKVCVCTTGYYQREYSSCRRISKKPDEPCGISLDCKFDNAVCTKNRTCQIQSKDVTDNEVEEDVYTIEELSRKKRNIFAVPANVLSSKKIGDNCKVDKDCPINAQCYQGSVCLCLKGYYTTDNSTCFPELGGNCTKDEDCPGKNMMCRDSKYCTCKQGFVTSSDSRYCDKLSRKIGWSCLRDEECGLFGPGGKCISKKCNCSDETHWVPKDLYCWVTKKVGETCEETEDCGGDNSSMTCTNKNCTCTTGTHSSKSGKKCNKDSKQVGGQCDENTDCLYDHAACNTTSHKCTCERGYLENKTVCTPGINGTCKSNDDCSVKNSKCKNNICECDTGNVPSKNLDICLPVADNIGIECTETEQCLVVDSECINGKCLCHSDSEFFPNYHECIVTRAIGQRCNRTQNCTVSHAICQNGYCVCKRGYRARGNKCVNGANTNLPFDLILMASAFLLLTGYMTNRN